MTFGFNLGTLGWYNNTMTVFLVTKTKDAAGSWTESRAALYSSVKCRLRSKTGIEREYLGRLGQEGSHRIYCNVLGDLLNPQKHLIVIGTREFDVTFPNDPHEEGDFWQIDVTERK